MTKYLISGYVGFDNFGDEAIAHVLSEKLRAEGAEKITYISSNPEKTAQMHNVYTCGMLDFLPALLDADVLISGGGSLLQDVTSLKSLLYYLAVILSGIILGKKVIIYAQGIGPVNSKIGRFLTKTILRFVSKISVRDSKSKNLLESWGIDAELVKDPVFDMNIRQKNCKGIVGIQLRNYEGINDKFLTLLADEIMKNFSDKIIQIFSLQDSIDLRICERFGKMLLDRGCENLEILNNLSVQDAIEKISDLEYLIAMRFHANLVGIKSGIKVLAINYDPKVEKLAKEYNLPIIELNSTDLSDSFSNLLM